MSALIQLAQMKIQLALVQKELAYNFRHWSLYLLLYHGVLKVILLATFMDVMNNNKLHVTFLATIENCPRLFCKTMQTVSVGWPCHSRNIIMVTCYLGNTLYSYLSKLQTTQRKMFWTDTIPLPKSLICTYFRNWIRTAVAQNSITSVRT